MYKRQEQHITITAGSNMSDDDIDKAVKEAAEFEAQDKKRKEAIDTRNEADAMVFQLSLIHICIRRCLRRKNMADS